MLSVIMLSAVAPSQLNISSFVPCKFKNKCRKGAMTFSRTTLSVIVSIAILYRTYFIETPNIVMVGIVILSVVMLRVIAPILLFLFKVNSVHNTQHNDNQHHGNSTILSKTFFLQSATFLLIR
jgi:hypothetical protein